MVSGQEKTPVAPARAPGLDNRSATAAGNPKIAPKNAKRHCAGVRYIVTPSAGDPFRVSVSGRIRWTLDRLRASGPKGCTPITDPAPRWSAYVHSLRELGVEIETITEPHGGDFAGHHARYVLRSKVQEGGAE
ncbi:hypothetical protein U879_20100 [Defluviimonas sp. 20V17]|uniref:Winged helix domain-containing protein n=1 Tax=Allgaiera indica TaxID=765699 RepID=A0AAN4URJ2_9RHOB|nr:hypothetical protein [Allgaiera indica]KDB01856.1 hypothetical protein U879_20100 [Defluviimonas sp. 20V17]GHE02337.1 hypothetical protein GCM10008024_21390 [Allgaiera indica]SDX31395.1 hypothetical protein SAMN05444006_113118 [Allgaiera indica]